MTESSPPSGAVPSSGDAAAKEERLQDLLDRWQEASDQGREIQVAELCRDCPELVPEAQRRLDVFRKMANLAKVTDAHPAGETTTHLASGDLSKQPTVAAIADSRSLQHLLKIFAAPKAPGELGRLGDYAILGLLGEGGMGAVFVAEDPMLNRRVALKVMRPEVAASPQARDRFLREARCAAKLQNDHIVPIFHIGKEKASGVWFITMPLLQGETLDQRLGHGPPLTVPEIARIGREVAEGLAAAHAQQLVHRDIKPANLWLESEAAAPPSVAGTSKTALIETYKPRAAFRVKILDFGLARPTVAAEEVTRSGAFLGTPGFMSPEQIDGQTLDGRTDLFSLGCVLYRLTTGKQPFEASTLTALLRATAELDPPWPHHVNPSLPLAFSQLIIRLLQKQPERRYASARDLVAAFEVLMLLFRR